MDGAAPDPWLTMADLKDKFSKARQQYKAALARIRETVPPGLRLVLGIVLIIGGVFAILPVLGVWMIPLGIAVAALDVVPLWRWFRKRMF